MKARIVREAREIYHLNPFIDGVRLIAYETSKHGSCGSDNARRR
jgi:hypothetical protein